MGKMMSSHLSYSCSCSFVDDFNVKVKVRSRYSYVSGIFYFQLIGIDELQIIIEWRIVQ